MKAILLEFKINSIDIHLVSNALLKVIPRFALLLSLVHHHRPIFEPTLAIVHVHALLQLPHKLILDLTLRLTQLFHCSQKPLKILDIYLPQ